MVEEPNKTLTAREAADMLQVSVRTWFRWCASGRAPAGVRIGGVRRWRTITVEKWLVFGCQPVGKRRKKKKRSKSKRYR